jgi:hypothetical protein
MPCNQAALRPVRVAASSRGTGCIAADGWRHGALTPSFGLYHGPMLANTRLRTMVVP